MAYRASMARSAVAVAALGLAAPSAFAGGFDIREQSAFFQGMAFAGAAAGGSALASMYWNPAAAGYVGDGITSESNYSAAFLKGEIEAKTLEVAPGVVIPASATGLDTTVDVARDAIVPASYYAYRLSSQMVLAFSLNSQFGLGTEPDNPDWVGQNIARTAKVFSVNGTPTLAYEIAPGIQVGAGVQIQYFDLKRFKSAAGPPGIGVPSSSLRGDDVGFGFTAGINLRPLPGTSIGLGFRSSIEHDLEGSVLAPGVNLPIEATIELPEKLTLGLRQDLMPGVRLHGTVEWTNWSRLDVIPVNLAAAPVTIATLDFQWEDGWYFAVGGEYDYSDVLTFRAGVGYEISPIQDPSQRLVQLPDADRFWLSAGASYKVGDLFGLIKDATLDIGYTHLFVEDSTLVHGPSATAAAGFPILTADTSPEGDVLAVGLRSKW